ncbi:hypothetical protein ACOTWN_04615 [Aliarcobacter butzleri]
MIQQYNKIDFLTKEQFFQTAEKIGGKHWQHLNGRWYYHNQAIEILKSLDIHHPKDVLEMGTVGMQLVANSHTIDFDESWNFMDKNPTYIHDAKITPWPIDNKEYEVFIALRVFQHLQPKQKEAFLEAKRIAKHVILCVPIESNDKISFTKPVGIKLNQLIEWNNGIKPNKIIETRDWGNIYYWDFSDTTQEDKKQ